MRTNNILISLLFFFTTSNLHSAIIFEDSFESGDTLSTNESGFKWTDNAWTSIVSSTEEVYGVSLVPRSIQNAAAFPGGDWTAHSGEHSMRFRYKAGEAMSEQRFDIGAPRNEIWLSYWLRVPVNFKYGPIGNPNKFLAIWMDGYSQAGDGSTVWLGLWRNSTGDADIAFTYSLGGKTSSTRYRQYTPFISSADAGRWMQIIFHIKAESAPGESDGIIQTYRRWNGNNYFTKIHDMLNAPLKISKNTNGFKAGYLLGWANAAYEENTEWLLDDFNLSDTPFLELNIKQPEAPTSLIAR